MLHILKEGRKADWRGRILHRKYLLYHVTEGKTGGKGRRERRRKQLANDPKENRR